MFYISVYDKELSISHNSKIICAHDGKGKESRKHKISKKISGQVSI